MNGYRNQNQLTRFASTHWSLSILSSILGFHLSRKVLAPTLNRPVVVIITKNRREDLRKAIRSAVEQSAKPEILVIDDGSADGTADMVQAEFPQVTLHRVEVSRGYIVQRNLAAKLAIGDVIFSIDDDAAFSTPLTVEQTLAEFDDLRVGAVAIPFINVNFGPEVFQRAPGDEGIIVQRDYVGTAHAVRKDLFLSLGGYREFLFHQGEERDFAIRLLNQGQTVRMGRADPILHYESPKRDFRRMDLFGRRNDVLFQWYNTPWPYLPIHLFLTTAVGLKFGFKVGRPLRMAHGLINGYAAILRQWSARKPVSRSTFALYRRLRGHPMPLAEIFD